MKIICNFNMLFSQVKRLQLLWLHNPLKSTLMCCYMMETSSVLPWKSLVIFRSFQQSLEIFGKCLETFIWPLVKNNFWKIFGNLQKVVGNLQKIVISAVISMSTYIKRTLHVSLKI